MADTIYAIAFMLIAVHRLELAATENGNSTVWECALKPALPLHNWATPLLGLLPLTTSMNFLICSVFPLWYLHVGWNYTIVLLSSPHLVSLFLSILNYVLLWGDQSPTPALCVAAKGAAHHVAYGAMLFLRIVANLASAVIYAVIILYLRKSQKLRELSVHQRKMHRNAAITLGFVTLNSMSLLFIPDLLLFFNPFDITQNYSTLLYSMTLSKTTINFFIYMWRYGELADMVTASTCRRVPRLRKYFPERSTGFRSSQVADNSRFSTNRSLVGPPKVRSRRVTPMISPRELDVPRLLATVEPTNGIENKVEDHDEKRMDTTKREETPRRVDDSRCRQEVTESTVTRQDDRADESEKIDKEEDTPSKNKKEEEIPQTEPVATSRADSKSADQKTSSSSSSFLPPIVPSPPVVMMDIRSFWSNN